MCICVYLILAVHNVTVHVERDRISFRAAAVIWPHKSGERERERERERCQVVLWDLEHPVVR